MPVDLESRFKRLLKEIVTISSGIRNSALDHANDQNFGVSERFRRQLETIRVSADAILEAFAKATLTSYVLDDRITDWLANGEPRLCVDMLKEMEDMLKPVEQVRHAQTPARPLIPTGNKLTAAMDFLDKNNRLFRFLLTPDVWNCEGPIHLPPEASQVNGLPITYARQEAQTAQSTASIETEYEPRSLSDTNQAMATAKREFMRQKLDEISRWLSPLDCTQKHNDARRLRQEGTCKWFPNTDVYESWRVPGCRFLWLHGKGGCGKSVLIASTIEHLKSTLAEEEVVVFFCCDFQNKRSTSSTELMRSLLSQLLRHIRDHGVDPGDFPDKILKQKSEGTLSLDNLGKLCDLVSRAASFFRYEPMIVIDALDECADIETLLPALVTLSQSDVRLLVTSRPDQTIMDHFTGLPSLAFENVTGEIASDIALHVRRELDSHSSAVPEMKNEIDAKLTERAEGRFRWVQCQLDTLKRCATREELGEALDSLPNELEATYERILGAIDERKSEGELARRVLALLMVAMEPLQLAQIIDGLSMDFQKRKNDHKTRQWLETTLLHALSSLVSYHEETDILALSHFTVKEYLTSRSALPMYQIVPHEAHDEAAQLCMGYISVVLKSKLPHGNIAPLQSFPMLSYVLSSGFNHLANVDSESTIALEELQSLGSVVRHHPSHWDRLCELREEVLPLSYPPWPLSRHDFVLYILIAYCAPGLLQTFLSSNYPLKPRIRTNPLVYAADLRRTEHAMVLLACGADINMRGPVVDDSHLASPLEVAIDLGDDVLVGELLRRGCLVTSQLLATAVCMPWCSTRVLVNLMQTDEFVEWALGIGDEELYRGIFNSARPDAGDSKKIDEDHVDLARRLRQSGQDLSADSQFGKELVVRVLHAAHISMLEFLLPPNQPPAPELLIIASTGNTPETASVVRFLLQKGVDVHAVSDAEGSDTALHLVAMCPWEPRSLELTGLLIDAGCNPHELNSDGETPLVIAVRQRHCSVVDLLLSCNVPLPPHILHVALAGHHRNSQMIQLLVLRGADVHAVTSYSAGTVLHRALDRCWECEPEGWDEDEDEEREIVCEARNESKCFDLVKLFIEAGCDPNIRNSRGKTVLEYALEQGFTSVVELLLQSNVLFPPDILLFALIRYNCTPQMIQFLVLKGANVHSTTSDGDTLLHLAIDADIEPRRLDLMKIFITAGCNPTACDSEGKTIMEVAVEYEDTSVVEFLLQSNVLFPPDILLFALRNCCSLEMIQHLVLKGADVHSTMDGNTLLRYVIDKESGPRRLDLVKTLITAGCNPATPDSEGKTIMEVAVEYKDIPVVELLLQFDVLFPPDILLFALRKHYTPQMVQFLVLKGANVHSTMSDGDTVLHLAIDEYVEGICYQLVQNFIDVGCNPTFRHPGHKTALEAAIERGYSAVVKLLLQYDHLFPPNILVFALRHRWTPPMIQFLLRKGADVHFTTPNGDTVLHLTIAEYVEGTCCYLVKKFADAGCNLAACNYEGMTVLETAMDHAYISVVEVLLYLNVPFPPDMLLFALRQRFTLEAIRFLIDKGADVHATAFNGDTILHLAIAGYAEEACHWLVQNFIIAGCNPTVYHPWRKTVLEAVVERGYTSVVELLLQFNVPLPPSTLSIALRHRSTSWMVQLLTRNGAYDRLAESGIYWNSLLQLVHESYSGHYCQLIIEILDASRQAYHRVHSSFGDEICMHVAKRPRLR